MENKKGLFFPLVLLSMLLLSFGVNSLKGVKDELERTSSPFTPVEKAGDAVEQVAAISFLKAPLTYTLETIKSDLSIGDNIVEHTTFSSKVRAVARIHLYNVIISIGISQLSRAIGAKPLPRQYDIKEVDKEIIEHGKKLQERNPLALFESMILGPVVEELIFTGAPHHLIDDISLRNKFSFISAIAFGLGHNYYDNYYIINRFVVMTSIANYINQRYVLKRNLDDALRTCIYEHIFNNILAVIRR